MPDQFGNLVPEDVLAALLEADPASPDPRAAPTVDLPLPGSGDVLDAPPAQFPEPSGVGRFAESLGLALAGSPVQYRRRRRASGIEDFLGALLEGAANTYGQGVAGSVAQRTGANERMRLAQAERNRANLAATTNAEERRLVRLQKRADEASDAARNLRRYREEKRIATDEAIRQTAAEEAIRAKSPEPREKERLVQIMGPGGTPIWVPESQAIGKPAAQAPRAPSGLERQSLAYYNRAQDAVNTLETPGPDGRSLEQRVSGSGLLGQAQLQGAPNVFKTTDQRRYRQAQRAFTEARLRKESGAAIPTHEYENDAKIYFAQPGDDRATIEGKRKARAVVLDGLRYSAGKAYEEYYGEAPPRTQRPSEPSAAAKSWADSLRIK